LKVSVGFMSTQEKETQFERLSKMFAEAGWQNEGWSLEIEHHYPPNFFFQEKDASTPLVDAPHLFKDVFIGRKTYMLLGGMIGPHTLIGRYCSISKDVFLGNSNHAISCLSTQFTPNTPEWQEEEQCYTVVGSDVWIGANVVITQGIHIGHGAVIGGGSVVTKDVPPYAVMAGNPARLIKYRFDEKLIEGLLETRWWTLPHELVEKLPQHDVAMCVDILRQGNGT